LAGAPKSFFQPQAAGQDAFAMVYSSKAACWSRVDFVFSTRLSCARRMAEGARKKLKHSTRFDETIQ
jgi:hypothetical protein